MVCLDSDYECIFCLSICASESLLAVWIKIWASEENRNGFTEKNSDSGIGIASILMVAGVLALLTQTKTIPSSGTINPFKVGVYNNAGATDVLHQINWTNVNPGGSAYQIVYVKNEATTVNMNLTMTTTGWTASPANVHMLRH